MTDIEKCKLCNKEGYVWQTKANGYGYERVKCDHIGSLPEGSCKDCAFGYRELDGTYYCNNYKMHNLPPNGVCQSFSRRQKMTEEKLEALKRVEQIEKDMRNDIDYCSEQCFVEDIIEIIEEFEKQMQHYGWTFNNDKELCEFIMQWR